MNKKTLSILILSLVLVVSLIVSLFALNTNPKDDTVQTVADTKFIKGSVLYEADFTKSLASNNLSEGFDLAVPLFSENTNTNISATTSANGLTLISKKSDAFLTFPQIDSKNYIFEAEVVIRTDENATLGIVNDMQGGASVAKGATICVLRLNNSKSIWSYYSRALEDWDGIDAESLGHPMDNPKNNDTVNFKLISFDNKNYLFVNNELIATYNKPDRKETFDNVGFYLSDGQIDIKKVKITSACSIKFAVTDATVKANPESKDADFVITAQFNKNNDFYKLNYKEDYSYNKNAPIKFGVLVADNSVDTKEALNKDTKNIQQYFFSDCTQDGEKIDFTCTLNSIPNEMLDKYYTLRAFALVGDEYFYFDTVSYSVLRLANDAFLNANDEEKEMIKQKFTETKGFNSTGAKSITFGLYSDLHYIEGMYVATIADLNSIFDRAYNNHASFVISAGDMTNDMKGSPELVNAFKNNKYGLGAYNVYGNHELESSGNTMAVVTPTLTNDENAIFGTASGKVEDGSIGYYYTDREGFRLIFLDSNYYYDEKDSCWKHNPPAYWGPPPEGTLIQSLGPEQLVWLEKVLMDAAEKDIPCIVSAHNSFSTKIRGGLSGDATAVRELYKKANEKNPGTVIMSINGHIHSNSNAMDDGVFYFNTNTVRNCWWQGTAEPHYFESHTYMKEVYDAEGNFVELEETPLNTPLCWYSDAPLSAVVTVYENGVIEVEGSEADWLYGIRPTNFNPESTPIITGGRFVIE